MVDDSSMTNDREILYTLRCLICHLAQDLSALSLGSDGGWRAIKCKCGEQKQASCSYEEVNDPLSLLVLYWHMILRQRRNDKERKGD